jgi:NAD(P)-dependent dehydrogenase (short-subunit alcohol dehydrogenase family)
MTWNLASGLEGKRVLVTGGAGGIGREVALAFGAAGSRVAVVDLAEDKVRAVVAEMEGGPHLPLAADLRPVAGHPKLVETVVGALGGLDVLVCAAAVLVRRASVDEVTPRPTGTFSMTSTSNRHSSSIRRRLRPFDDRDVEGASSTSPRKGFGAAASAVPWLTPRPRAASSR